MAQIAESARKLAKEFLEFVNRAVTPFHVTSLCKERLRAAGFSELKETENWKLERGGKYYFTRNLTTLCAFRIGEKFDVNNTGFKIIGAHTDSPCLRLAPVSKLESNKMHQTYVNTYGGGLWHTWFDRDLTLGGRVVYKSEQGYDYKLYHHAGPLIKIPNLAIHLTTADERKFAPNSESHLRPILSSEVYNQLTGLKDEKEKKDGAQGKHYYQLLQMVAKSLGIDVDAITDLDFYLSDSNPGTLFGMNQEFISAPRIDNLISTFFCVKAIAAEQAHNAESSFVNMVCLFDHEEVGSTSAQGANSTLMENSLKRIFQVMSSEDNSCKPDSFFKALQRSFQISSDVSHGVHPNYAEKHQTNHKVKINEGIVLKTNCNQRYATDSVSLTLLRAVADSANVPIQDFVVKNDSPCGSTIGPLTAAQTGIKTIDLGSPVWGMHSIRETAGVLDCEYKFNLFVEFFKKFELINQKLLDQ